METIYEHKECMICDDLATVYMGPVVGGIFLQLCMKHATADPSEIAQWEKELKVWVFMNTIGKQETR